MDKNVMEQEVVYVAFADPEKGKPTHVFFGVAAPSESQNVPGLKKVIINTLKRNSLESVIEKIVFLLSNSASCQLWKTFWVDQIILSVLPLGVIRLVLWS